MFLCFSPSPTFASCATRCFAAGERHVTRVYKKCVLILMMEGELSFREAGELVTLQAGEYYIQRDGLLQEGVDILQPPTYFYIEFYGSFTDLEGEGLRLRGSFYKSNVQPMLERLEALFQKRNGNLFLFNSYMNRVFGELWTTNAPQDDGGHIAEMLRNDIDARYAESIGIKALSRRFGYDADHLTRVFRRQYGITPHQYRIRLRMEHARWLLENTELSVEAVADAVGYREPSAFYRAFQKIYQLAPRKGQIGQ